MMLTRDDGGFIQRALELAGRGEGHTRPNPPVGAVVVKNGKIIGEGWHRRCGGDHAEVAAIKDALRNLKAPKPQGLEACTLYVTLEPCSKPGRVGACTDAIIAAGVKRVVYLVSDPNPKNRGKAKRALAKHGIDCVKVCRRTCEEKAWDYCLGLKPLVECGSRMIAPFAKHVTTGLPFVTVKLAMSLDGKICDDRGMPGGFPMLIRARAPDGNGRVSMQSWSAPRPSAGTIPRSFRTTSAMTTSSASS